MREQLTESDVKKIQEEIDHRKLVVRKEAIEAVKEARAQGDLSENFEYYAAKKDKNRNESRIRYLENMLKLARLGAVIMPPMPSYYHQPKSLGDLERQFTGRLLDQLDVDHQFCRRWGEAGQSGQSDQSGQSGQ